MRKELFRSAFTLVELLAVIGIMGLLLGILLPALAAARRQANATACLSNLRQLGLAIDLYLVDNRQTYPQPFQDTDLTVAGSATTAAAKRTQRPCCGSTRWTPTSIAT